MKFRFHTEKNGIIYISYNKVYDKQCTVETDSNETTSTLLPRKIKHEKLDNGKYNHYINMPNGEKINLSDKDKITLKEIYDKKKQCPTDSRIFDELFQAILTTRPKNSYFYAPCTFVKQKARNNSNNGKKHNVLCNVAKFDQDTIILHPVDDNTVKDTKYDIVDFINELGFSIRIDNNGHNDYYKHEKTIKMHKSGSAEYKLSEVFFELNSGWIVTAVDILKSAEINGIDITGWKIDDIRAYAKYCPGVKCENNSPSIEEMIKNNQTSMSIIVYKIINKVSMKEAQDAVNKICEDLKNKDRA